jgi:hypothetical protein
MVHLGQAVLDSVLVAHAVEDMLAVPNVLLAWRELDAVVGQYRMDEVGHGQDQVTQELGGLHLAYTLHKTNKGELAGAVASQACWPDLFWRSDQSSADG